MSAVDRTHAWAVGTGGLIHAWDGQSWQPQTSGTKADRLTVWAVSPQLAFAGAAGA